MDSQTAPSGHKGVPGDEWPFHQRAQLLDVLDYKFYAYDTELLLEAAPRRTGRTHHVQVR